VLGQHFLDVDIGDDGAVLLEEADIDLVRAGRRVDRAQLLAGDQVDGVADGRIIGDAALEFGLVGRVEDFAEQVDRGDRDVVVALDKFSQDTSVIMATMTELAQRMLTKRPTVARTSETGIWLWASSPTRASDPRTEITRPKDVT
jgi:hypothetical protein